MIRVLYRLRSLSEQGPFDAATFSYAFPLLSQILLIGGIPGEEEDDPLEQVALALEIIKFHCGECNAVTLAVLCIFLIESTQFPALVSLGCKPLKISSILFVLSQILGRKPRRPSLVSARRSRPRPPQGKFQPFFMAPFPRNHMFEIPACRRFRYI